MRAALALVSMLGAACGAAQLDDARGDAAVAPDADEPLLPDAGTALTGACAPGAVVPANDATWTIPTADGDRTFIVHLPPSYVAGPRVPAPLVLNFHGYGNSASIQRDWSNLDDEADRDGFVVVYPEGTGLVEGWNAGACCGAAVTSGVDDIGFTMQMLDTLEAQLCVDPKRVYASGFSNGGFLSHRLACEHAERIAAVATVAGVMGIDACHPSRPIAVWMAHGTADPVVPYGGSAVLGFRSVADTVAGWTERNHCLGAPVQTFHQGDTDCEAQLCADSGVAVELCTIQGGSHTWPNGDTPLLYTSRDLDADAHIWAFFQAHQLP